MSATPSPFPWRRFLRRRFPIHAESWVYAQVPLWWAALIMDAPPTAEVDALYAIVAFVVAAGLVGALAGLAVLLRFPWWLLVPFCLLSMGVEGLWRKLAHRPWQRKPVPRRWYFSNAVALWQGWGLKNRRWQRRLSRQTTACFARFHAAVASTWRRLDRPRPANVVRLPPPPDSGLMDYVFTVLGAHVGFWYAVSFVGAWIYFAANERLDWLLAFIVTMVLFIAGTVFPVLPLVLGAVALLSALIVGLALSPIERAQRVRLMQPPPTEGGEYTPKTTQRAPNWLLPLALGLWIGSAWGDDG